MSDKRILLVDEDPDFRLALGSPLQAAGYQIRETRDIPAAKAALREFHPNLIVMEVMVETATSGFQFALDLHSQDPKSEFKEHRQLPIIMLTAIPSTTPLRFTPDEDYLPAQTFLEKPVKPEDLIAAVRRCIGPPAGHPTEHAETYSRSR